LQRRVFPIASNEEVHVQVPASPVPGIPGSRNSVMEAHNMHFLIRVLIRGTFHRNLGIIEDSRKVTTPKNELRRHDDNTHPIPHLGPSQSLYKMGIGQLWVASVDIVKVHDN